MTPLRSPIHSAERTTETEEERNRCRPVDIAMERARAQRGIFHFLPSSIHFAEIGKHPLVVVVVVVFPLFRIHPGQNDRRSSQQQGRRPSSTGISRFSHPFAKKGEFYCQRREEVRVESTPVKWDQNLCCCLASGTKSHILAFRPPLD